MKINTICYYSQVYFLYFDSMINFDLVSDISNDINNYFKDKIEIKFFISTDKQINNTDRYIIYIIKNNKLLEVRREKYISKDDIISIFSRIDLRQELEKKEKFCIIRLNRFC